MKKMNRCPSTNLDLKQETARFQPIQDLNDEETCLSARTILREPLYGSPFLSHREKSKSFFAENLKHNTLNINQNSDNIIQNDYNKENKNSQNSSISLLHSIKKLEPEIGNVIKKLNTKKKFLVYWYDREMARCEAFFQQLYEQMKTSKNSLLMSLSIFKERSLESCENLSKEFSRNLEKIQEIKRLMNLSEDDDRSLKIDVESLCKLGENKFKDKLFHISTALNTMEKEYIQVSRIIGLKKKILTSFNTFATFETFPIRLMDSEIDFKYIEPPKKKKSECEETQMISNYFKYSRSNRVRTQEIIPRGFNDSDILKDNFDFSSEIRD